MGGMYLMQRLCRGAAGPSARREWEVSREQAPRRPGIEHLLAGRIPGNKEREHNSGRHAFDLLRLRVRVIFSANCCSTAETRPSAPCKQAGTTRRCFSNLSRWKQLTSLGGSRSLARSSGTPCTPPATGVAENAKPNPRTTRSNERRSGGGKP